MIIREFRSEDAAFVSELIVENLKTVNIRDYSEELVNALASYKNPQQLWESARKCDAFVAMENSTVLGVAMLDGNKITNVFVHTQRQGSGIGRSLIAHIERLARERSLSRLVVDSSITAAGFYTRCGYQTVKRLDKPFRGIKNIVFEMVKVL